MNEFLKKDINVKIISVLFAVLLWFFVLDSSANPFDTATLNIPLKIQNEYLLQEKGLGLKNKDFVSNVNIVIKGRRDKINSITANDFEAVLDYSRIKNSGNEDLTIDVKTNKEGISIEAKKPQAINVQVEKIIKASFKVEIEPKGKLRENYKIIKKASDPEYIEIEGIESLVKSVAVVKTEININGLSKIPIMRAECKMFGKNGDEITGLGKNYNVDIALEVAKEVPVTPVLRGKLARDFVDKGTKISPEKVLITGLPDVIEKIESVETEAVNIENLNKNAEVVSFLKVPEGVRLVDSAREVKVSVYVEQLIRRDYVFTKDEVAMVNKENDDSLNYEIVNNNITVGIKGRQKELDQFNKSSLKPTIDVSRLTEGTHKVPLKVTLSGELKLVEEQVVEIKISKKEVKSTTEKQNQ